jgi:hypothetical protein
MHAALRRTGNAAATPRRGPARRGSRGALITAARAHRVRDEAPRAAWRKAPLGRSAAFRPGSRILDGRPRGWPISG